MNTNLNMQTMPIDRLKPAKYNPRKDLKPGDPAYEKIKRSLHDFGYVDPIVWNEVTGNIVGGHQAAIVFDVAVDMVKQSPALSKRIKIIPSTKRIFKLIETMF